MVLERTYRSIFGSQIAALKRLNVSPLSRQELQPIYDAAVNAAPSFYRDYPFEAWLAFLKLQELIVEANDSFSISDLGEDFLRYILYQRYPEEKFG